MDLPNEKCVMVIDARLPVGLIANAAAILGISLGRKRPELVGADVRDGAGNLHLGIIEFPVPILRGDAAAIRSLRERLRAPEHSCLTVADFTDLAQGCKTYDEFVERMRATDAAELSYLGIAICGAKREVNRLTGSLPLLR